MEMHYQRFFFLYEILMFTDTAINNSDDSLTYCLMYESNI